MTPGRMTVQDGEKKEIEKTTNTQCRNFPEPNVLLELDRQLTLVRSTPRRRFAGRANQHLEAVLERHHVGVDVLM
jgi:hypothetical protein